MKRLGLVLVILFCGSLPLLAQSFEWTERPETLQATLGQSVRFPIRLRNTTDKPQYYVIRKVQSDLGSQQKGYFCMDDECQDPMVDQIVRKLEPGETMLGVYFTVETGFLTTVNVLRFEVFARTSPNQAMEHTLTLAIEEKPTKSLVFQSRDITINDVYPNPVVDQAFIDYRIHNETIKAKVTIHNILGSAVGAYDMPSSETRVKISAEDLSSGVYFYTVYLDNVGILTHKLVVRK